MNKYKNLYLSKEQWENLKNFEMRTKTVSPMRKLLAGERIKKSIEAIKISQQRLVQLSSFKTLVKSHWLKQKSYSRETISRLINRSDEVSDVDFIEWIKIFMSFFYTDLCIFISPEKYPVNEDSEGFIICLKDYCSRWEDRKKKRENVNKQKKPFAEQQYKINRKKAIIGRWEGYADQEFEDGKIIRAKAEGELTLDPDDMIRGELRYSYETKGETVTDTITVLGEFLHDSFLRLNYINIEDFIKQFGAVVLEIDPTGSYLKGKFVGFGANSKMIIKADCFFNKIFTD